MVRMEILKYVFWVEVTTGGKAPIRVNITILVNMEPMKTRVQIAKFANDLHSSWHFEQIQLPHALKIDPGIDLLFASDYSDQDNEQCGQ